MNQVRTRPFYTEFAWAYDLIIDRPVRKECAFIAAWLADRGILPGATLLDAGCGTGRYAVELARRGYVVEGIDRSPGLIEVAKAAAVGARGGVSFEVRDITDLPIAHYDGILCRGVLNDVVDDAERDAIVAAFARALRSNGALILDVREWGATAQRKAREPLFRKRVSTERGELTFTSVTTLDPEHRQLLLFERHELAAEVGGRVSDYHFVMRCWERDELGSLLAQHGFANVSWFGAYDPGIRIGATDRIVALTNLLEMGPNHIACSRR
jgi:SAM-dependent methyltransferase